MELFDHLLLGFQVSFTLTNIAYCFVGVLLGTLVGVLPGLGPLATISMLLPITFGLPPVSALIMLAGIYYGAQYGGSISAILINLPGEATAVITCIDGHQMARNGRAGPALGIAAIGSFIAGCVATVVVALFAPMLARAGLSFGPSDYFSLMVLGLVGAVVLASGSLIKAIAMVVLGLFLGLVGTDVNSGIERFTFGIPQLGDGLEFIVIAMGVFGFAEIIMNLQDPEKRDVIVPPLRQLLPNRADLKRSAGPIVRGSLVGSVLGILPGGGALLSSFASYAVEKKISKDPSRFGKGAIEGVAGPESANNAGAQTSFIPLLTLGVPSNAVMALMVGAMIIHGITPGPQVMTNNPDLFWGLIVSMLIGNLMLIILNLPLIGIWIKLLSVPYRFLFPAILLFCCIGVYSVKFSTLDVTLSVAFGVLGYVFVKLECEPAPLMLGFILGPMMEENLRRAMLLAHGDPGVFVERPISLSMLLAAAMLLILAVIPSIGNARKKAFVET